MKVGLSGAQSTGKSTLLIDLQKESFFQDYKICNEVTRELAAKGFQINEAGTDETQEAVMRVHEDNLKNKNMLTDRTALDGLVYTNWLYQKGNVSSETMQKVERKFYELISQYDLIFYIKPEFDLHDDGVRSPDTKFRDEIAIIFGDFIQTFNIKVIQITGSREDRVTQVLDTIRSKVENIS